MVGTGTVTWVVGMAVKDILPFMEQDCTTNKQAPLLFICSMNRIHLDP